MFTFNFYSYLASNCAFFHNKIQNTNKKVAKNDLFDLFTS